MSARVTVSLTAIENASRTDITAVAITADGHVFAGDKWGEIRRWRIEDSQQTGPTMQANGTVESAVVSSDGQWLVTGDDGRIGIVWDARTHEKVYEVTEHTHFVYSVDISGNSTRFASGSCDKTVRIFDIMTGVRVIPPLQHDHAVVGLKFSPSGDQLVTATYNKCVRIYDSHIGDTLFEVSVQVMHTPTTPFAWSFDGRELFVVSPGRITCLSTSNFSSNSEWLIHSNSTRASVVTDGQFIACASGPSVSLWNAISHEQVGQIIEDGPDVLCITCSSNREFFACGQGNRVLVYRFGKFLPDHYLSLSPFRPSPISHSTTSPVLSRPPNPSRPPSKEKDVALSPNPTGPVGFLVERSRSRAEMRLWEDALEDANEVLETDASCHYAYERKYVALHGMGQYDEAIEAFDSMLYLIERSEDPETRGLRRKYVSTVEKRKAIEGVVHKYFKYGPLVFIDVVTGRLCDRQVLPDLFRFDPTFKELVSSMTEEIDKERIWRVVSKYFGYAMLSHVWGNGKDEEKRNEPSLKAVKKLESVYCLPDTPMNNKLRNFCARVTELGYRWAWSDTCCIDKSDDAILNRSLSSMYKWYEASDATLVFLGDVSSDLGDILHSLWMTRAWTLQEAFAPKRLLFYDRDWNIYRGIVSDNHKNPGVVLQELANATGVPPEILVSFHPDSLGVREKLRLASTRTAAIEEDAAYALIGFFRSDLIPRYGEGEDALGHLLEGIVAHLGEVTVLAWTGSPSRYNSCLPSTLAVYSQTSFTPPTLDAAHLNLRTTQLSTTLSKDDAIDIYYRVVRLPPPRFANRRLQLPCVVFYVKSLGVKDLANHGNLFRAKVSGLGMVEFTTADNLPLAEPRKFIFVHPWISDIQGPHPHDVIGGDTSDSDIEEESEPEVGRRDASLMPASPSDDPTTNQLDEHTLALQMIVRLQQPFSALLLLRQPGGEYKRVAAENEIVVQISRNYIRPKDIHTKVLDIL